MALQPDLYAAFSRALGSAGMNSADHSAISQAMADDITSAITSCIRSAVTTTSYTGITLVPPGVGAVAVGIDITAMAYLSTPLLISLFGATR